MIASDAALDALADVDVRRLPRISRFRSDPTATPPPCSASAISGYGPLAGVSFDRASARSDQAARRIVFRPFPHPATLDRLDALGDVHDEQAAAEERPAFAHRLRALWKFHKPPAGRHDEQPPGRRQSVSGRETFCSSGPAIDDPMSRNDRTAPVVLERP